MLLSILTNRTKFYTFKPTATLLLAVKVLKINPTQMDTRKTASKGLKHARVYARREC